MEKLKKIVLRILAGITAVVVVCSKTAVVAYAAAPLEADAPASITEIADD